MFWSSRKHFWPAKVGNFLGSNTDHTYSIDFSGNLVWIDIRHGLLTKKYSNSVNDILKDYFLQAASIVFHYQLYSVL